jgi:hypothetical protein
VLYLCLKQAAFYQNYFWSAKIFCIPKEFISNHKVAVKLDNSAFPFPACPAKTHL